MNSFRVGVCLLFSCLCIVHTAQAETIDTDSDFILNQDGSYSLSSDSAIFTDGEEWISTEEDESMISSLNVTNLTSGTISILRDQLPNVSTYQVDDESSLYTVVDGVLFSKDMKILIAYPIAKKGDFYQIPTGVELIEDCAFAGNQHLRALYFPSSVRVMGSNSCARMRALACVYFCEGIEVIGDYAFEACINLREISTPASLKIIGFAAFRYTSISHVSMADGILCIMGEAFAHCNITEQFRINLPSTIIYCDTNIFCPEMNLCVLLEKGSYIDIANIIPSGCIVYQ